MADRAKKGKSVSKSASSKEVVSSKSTHKTHRADKETPGQSKTPKDSSRKHSSSAEDRETQRRLRSLEKRLAKASQRSATEMSLSPVQEEDPALGEGSPARADSIRELSPDVASESSYSRS